MAYYEKENGILDNMLEACDFMLDVLTENNRYKYLETMAKKQDEVKDYASYGKAFTGYNSYSDNIKDQINAEKQYNRENREKDRNGSYVYKKFFYSQGEDKLANKDPGSVLDKQEEKKRAIKETCLTILSILDDIE